MHELALMDDLVATVLDEMGARRSGSSDCS
jgi:hypothetical protein